jgi:exodeoxyribonuclease-3
MKIATWNVNSLKVRLPQVLDWLERERPDVLALQETKTEDAKFPQGELEAAGYRVRFSGQKTYNGVAVLSRETAADLVTDVAGLDDLRRRILSVTEGGWLRSELALRDRVVVRGDFNIAPEERDVHDPDAWREKILRSTPERQAFQACRTLGVRAA